MDSEEARKFVISTVSVSRYQITTMKTLLLEHFGGDGPSMLNAAVSEVSPPKPTVINLNQSLDPTSHLRDFAEWVSWNIAGCEALWELVHSNVLLSSGEATFEPSMSWTTVIPGSGGHSAGWRFPEFQTPHPHRFFRTRGVTNQILCDPGLFLNELSLPDLHVDVQNALREAVLCLRAELFTAAVVMLGKASEGAWIEMGIALLHEIRNDEAKREKLRRDWSGPDVGFAKKLREIVKFYESNQDIFRPIGAAADVQLDELRMAMLWSDSLRDTRNIVHHNADASITLSLENVSTFFLTALPYLRVLHRITRAVPAATQVI